MTPQTQFAISNAAALPFWALMIFAPRWSVTRALMRTLLAPGIFAALYAAMIAPHLGNVLAMLASPPDLDATIGELAKPQTFVVAWIHYLAFDLFVGRWIYLDAEQRRLHPLLAGPCLFFTLMTGPLGFVMYLATRTLALKSSQDAVAT